MACVVAAGRIDLPEEMTPTSRLRGVALVERLHQLAREAPPAELESVLRPLPAAQWAKLEDASRSWRPAAGARVDPVVGEGAAAVATMVRDGFARQRALTELVRRPDPDPRVTTRAVALRALDHVEAVRTVAVAYLRAMSGVEHLEAAPGDQRGHLQPGVGALVRRDRRSLLRELGEPGRLGQRHHRDQPGRRHEIRIVERHRGPRKSVRVAPTRCPLRRVESLPEEHRFCCDTRAFSCSDAHQQLITLVDRWIEVK